jgi:hypothetical protein
VVGPGLSAGAGVNANVPVYYLGSNRSKTLLYREYHLIAAGDGSPAERTRAAVADMLDAGKARDPDYTSPWPGRASVRDVAVGAGTVTVDLADATVNSVDAATGRQALQQLIYTATAASTTDANQTNDVHLLFDGKPLTTLWGAIPVGGTLRRGAMAEVLAPVWLYEPQEGDAIGRTFTVRLAGVVFEGAARLRVRSGSTVVVDQPVQLSVGSPDQGTATVPLSLPPGRYTIEAFFVSLKDGTVQGLDDHTITVR